MLILGPEHLTGRVRSHVIDVPEPPCTLHPQAAAAFLALRSQAAKDGIDLVAVSSFRDFERQCSIWNDKFYGRRPLLDATEKPLDRSNMDAEALVRAILVWSALPGASRHHWGTEIDVIDRSALPPGQQPALLQREYAAGGVFERLGAWLPQHCPEHGFFLPYDIDRGGVRPEPWHLSYAPVSGKALADLTVEVLQQALRGVELGGAAVIGKHLQAIHTRYVTAIGSPQINLAATPS